MLDPFSERKQLFQSTILLKQLKYPVYHIKSFWFKTCNSKYINLSLRLYIKRKGLQTSVLIQNPL